MNGGTERGSGREIEIKNEIANRNRHTPKIIERETRKPKKRKNSFVIHFLTGLIKHTDALHTHKHAVDENGEWDTSGRREKVYLMRTKKDAHIVEDA